MRSTLLMLLMSVCILGRSTPAQKVPTQDRPQFKLLHILSTDYDQNSVVFTPNSQQILSGGWDSLVGDGYDGDKKNRYFQYGRLRRWSVASGKRLQEQPTKFPLMAMAYSPDGRLFATGYGSQVRISSAATGKTIRRMQIDADSDPTGVESLVFSPDGLTLACGTVVAEDHSEPGPFYLWNVKTGKQYDSSYRGFFQPLDRNGGHRDQWFSVAPASNTMVSQSKDGLVIRQFRAGGFSKRILPGFNTAPLTTSQDGRYLFGLDDSLQVWDLKANRQVADVGCDAEDHGYPQVAVSPDMRYVAVSKSHKIFVWRIIFPEKSS